MCVSVKELHFTHQRFPCAVLCGNYILDTGEECDDGNPYSGDGCSATCLLEDQNFWLCTNSSEGVGPTTCCRALTNPLNESRVCSCLGVQSGSSKFSINPDCTKSNINECSVGMHNCDSNAVCVDRNGASSPAGEAGFECVCPPGLLGDGVSECRLYAYLTEFTVANPSISKSSFDEAAFMELLISSVAIPYNISLYRINLDVGDYSAAAAPSPGRRVLSSVQQKVQQLRRIHNMRHQQQNQQHSSQVASHDAPATVPAAASVSEVRYSSSGRKILQAAGVGISVKVSISSVSAEEQVIITAGINATKLEVSGYTLISSAVSVMSDMESIEDAAYSTAAGFKIASVQFNETEVRWVLTVKYTPDAPNVLTSLYVSKPGAKPYTVDAINSYYASQHPCLRTDSVCCLNDYKRIYAVGAFASNITSSVGACDEGIQAAETLSLGFNPDSNGYIVDHLFDDYPNSYVERVSAGEVKLHIAQSDLSDQGLAKKDPLPDGRTDGYLLTFFVGMTYFTLLPANALSVTASQVQVQLSISNSLTFSFASAQDYTVLKYITLSLIETKWIQDFQEKRMQLAKVGFVLPTGLRQNMLTGLVPLTSIRFAVSKTTPSQLNASAWTNPCFSVDASALYDTTNVYGYRDMYQQAQQQTCAARQDLCTNPTSIDVTMQSNLVNFYFPIGENTITPAMLASFPAPYFMFVYFQLSALDTSGRIVVTNLFAKAQLGPLSLSKNCETVSAEVSLMATTKVDIGVGFVGLDDNWNSTMRIFRDVTQSVSLAGCSSFMCRFLACVCFLFDLTFLCHCHLGWHTFLVLSIIKQTMLLTFLGREQGAVEGALIDSTNLTAWGNNSGPSRTIQSGLISLVVRDTSAIFRRPSAYEFYINVEQLTTMHFLGDDTRFRSMLSLIKANQAFNVVNDPVNQRPYINFTDEALSRCTRLSCALYNSIYGGSVKRPGSVHSFSTGIGTTSLDSTRDWLLDNVLQATDDYSRALATNMTSLVRQNFGVDDRFTKAWYVFTLFIFMPCHFDRTLA